MSETIVLLDKTSQERVDEILPHVPEGMTFVYGTSEGTQYLKEIIRDADFAIAGQVAVPGEVFRAATRLKLLHKSGVGIDNIEVETARELGIIVARTPGSNAIPVAEFALGSAIAALRGLAYGNAQLKNGAWRGAGRLPNKTFILSGKTVGIIGFGAIGQAFARLLQGFGCTILYHQRSRLSPERESELRARYASLDEILEASDLVSLNCPLTSETANMIDRAAFQKMKRTSVLVNVARGGIVVEQDLIWALESRIIAAAAVDVFELEPLPATSPLLRPIDNLVLTPHIAAIAADTFVPNLQRMFRNILLASKGEPIPDGDRVV